MREGLFAAHHALEERHWWFRARRRAIREVGDSLLPPGGKVVDIGCGTGADVASFSSRYERYGIDRSQTAISFARSRHENVDFRVAELPGGGGADPVAVADLLLLCDVLEHIEDHRGFLDWVVSNMKTGSHLLITVPADPRLWSPHDEAYGHYRRYTMDDLAAVWSGLPVRVVLLAPFNRLLYPAARLARAVARRRGRSWGSEKSDLRLPWAPLNWALERIFSLEAHLLTASLRSAARPVRGRGVSLFAVLQKDGPL